MGPSTPSSKAAQLAAELRAWWAQESADWDSVVAGGADTPSLSGGLWDGMPTVDSKAVARTSPIFKKHLGIPLDVKLVRAGGYASIDDVIGDLVPKMEAAAQARQKAQRAG